MKDLSKIYPPYVGDEPYIFLCFEPTDAAAAKPILNRLWQRGCRIWYPAAGSSEWHNQSIMERAGLVIVINTERYAVGKAKRNMMFLQAKGVPVIVVDCIRADVISTGEHAGTTHVSALGVNMESVEAEIITAEGFSQDYIGQRPPMPAPGWIKWILALLTALAAAAAIFLGLSLTGVIHPQQDPATVYTLELEHIPEDITEFEQYPNLETIIIPQSQAGAAEDLLDRYTIVLKGGE